MANCPLNDYNWNYHIQTTIGTQQDVEYPSIFRSSQLFPGRINRFFKNKRAIVSLWILIALYVLSFFSELIANDKPLLIKYNNRLYFFAAYIFYSDKTFGGTSDTEARYHDMVHTHSFNENKDNFIIYPPIPFNPYTSNHDSLAGIPPTPPDNRHILGTDEKGRDVCARILYGFRMYMTYAIILLLIEVFIGIIIGTMQGFIGGILNAALHGFVKILSALPFFYIIILVTDIIGRGFIILIMLMSIFNWIGLSLYIKTTFCKIRKYQFVDAAKKLGSGSISIFFSEFLPFLWIPIITFAPFSLITSLCILTGLDFLGSGLPAPYTGWGDLIRQGTEHLSHYWLSVYPVIILILLLLLLTFMGQGLRNIISPDEYPRLE